MQIYEVIYGFYSEGYRSMGMYLKKEDADKKAKELAEKDEMVMVDHLNNNIKDFDYVDDTEDWCEYIKIKTHIVQE